MKHRMTPEQTVLYLAVRDEKPDWGEMTPDEKRAVVAHIMMLAEARLADEPADEALADYARRQTA